MDDTAIGGNTRIDSLAVDGSSASIQGATQCPKEFQANDKEAAGNECHPVGSPVIDGMDLARAVHDENEAETSYARKLFGDVVGLIRSTTVTAETKLSDETRLRMYGLYKRATVGRLCCEADGLEEDDSLLQEERTERPARPSVFNVVARYKYDAWADCDTLSRSEARMEYVRIAASQENWLGRECSELLRRYEEFQTQRNSSGRHFGGVERDGDFVEDFEDAVGELPPLPSVDETSPASVRQLTNRTKQHKASSLKLQRRETSIFERSTGIKPLIPRGQLDANFSDFAFALGQCCNFIFQGLLPFSMIADRTRRLLEERIRQLWVGSFPRSDDIIAALSVRSLLDMYLSAKSYKPGAEIILVPPITIRGMTDVISFHKLTVVSVDIPATDEDKSPQTIGVDLEAVEAAISERTVAIMVVHPFGLICTTDEDMFFLRQVANKHNLDIIEDCAECYSGIGKDGATTYGGSVHSDIAFFSFGTIKCATAFGGGIAVLKNSEANDMTPVGDKMRRVQQSLYGQQSNLEYMVKVLKCSLLYFLSRHPALCGLALVICNALGIDYDGLVTSAVKGFNAPHLATSAKGTAAPSMHRHRVKALVRQIRKKPSPALLAFLHRRLTSSKTTADVVKARAERCESTSHLISNHAPSIAIPRGVEGSMHLFWLYPIVVPDPILTSRVMLENGFDVPRGTSQLDCIASHVDCPRAKRLMDGILYLPIASRDISGTDVHFMLRILNMATNAPVFKCEGDNESLQGEATNAKCSVSRLRSGLSDWLRHKRFVVIAAALAHAVTRGYSQFALLHAVEYVLLCYIFAYITCIVMAQLLRVYVGRDYMRLSTALSKYGNIISEQSSGLEPENEATQPASAHGVNDGEDIKAPMQSQALLNMDALRIPSNETMERAVDVAVQKQKVLLTGATGFVGSLLLRDLLLHRTTLALDGGVVVICRSRGTQSASDRIARLLSEPMFSFLSKDEKNALVSVIEGDVTLSNIGMSPEDTELICETMRISHVFHCAASVSFTQSLDEAAVSNITSSLQLQGLTKRLKDKHARYVHISTAFVHGATTGTSTSSLPERLYPLHPYDPGELYRSMVETQSYASTAMRELGFPNTYTFSKCVCEHLLLRDSSVDTILIRPSIVGPAVQEPSEGWAGKRPSTLVAAACLYLKFQYNLWSFGQEKVPVIPVDVVCRFIIAKAFCSGSDDDIVSPDTESSHSSIPTSSDKEDYWSYQQVSLQSRDISRSTSPDCMSLTSSSTNASVARKRRIFTAAWDAKSPESSSFLWLDYAITITHLGSVMGYISRYAAFIGILFTVKIFPRMEMSLDTFRLLHRVLVQSPLDAIQSICKSIGLRPSFIRGLEQLSPFLDLPLLFYPFTNATFQFQSDLVAPKSFNGQRYMLTCALAAERFVKKLEHKMRKEEPNKTETRGKEKTKRNYSVSRASIVTIAGRNHSLFTSDLLWAHTQPRGNIFIRVAGWVMMKLLYLTAAEVTVDIGDFAFLSQSIDVANQETENTCHVVLAPTHRSLFDFMILSFVAFALPEIGIDLPRIAAAEDFERIPVLGWLARGAGAFFLKRGRGTADPTLRRQIEAIKKGDSDGVSACIEVFIEGERSRDRRFAKPKTGFLRCLQETGGEHVILPVTISYEGIPEQSTLADEANGGCRGDLGLPGLFSWITNAVRGKINLGRVHVSASKPLRMTSGSETNIAQLARTIQLRQQSKIMVSSFHIEAASRALGLQHKSIREAVDDLGCPVWAPHCKLCLHTYCGHVTLPSSGAELWSIMLHFGHVFAPFFLTSHPCWSKWLNPSLDDSDERELISKPVQIVVEAMQMHFDAADNAVNAMVSTLCKEGYSAPTPDHVMQYYEEREGSIPKLLFKAALIMMCERDNKSSSDSSCDDSATLQDAPCSDLDFAPTKALFVTHGSAARRTSNELPSSSNIYCNGLGSESFGAWGYSDSGFIVEIRQDGARCVTMKGDRYNICGVPLPRLVPFLEKESKVRVNTLRAALPSLIAEPRVADSDLRCEDLSKIRQIVGDREDRISTRALDRARHGTGQTQEDMFLIRSGRLHQIRVPDAVIWPSKETEVEALISLASKEGWCLIPFGGGTNVSHSTRCPSKHEDPRPIISIDMRVMSKILWVNEEDGLAHVQAGITGSALVREMEDLGYTIGHEPDSIEFSTLGGWIATKASGMKRNKYGNIEDIVKDVRVAGPKGMMWQNQGSKDSAFGRVSTGMDLCSLMIGSEGSFGIITSAIIKIWPVAECMEYESVILPCFEDGVSFVRNIARMSGLKPASVRLLDNEQFRLGRALKEEPVGLEFIKNHAMKLLSELSGTISADEAVCATITFEGSIREVEMQKKIIREMTKQSCGILAGPKVGRAGYDLTFAIGYLRDFAMSYHFLAESFETFVPWSKLEELVYRTKTRIRQEHKKRFLPGEPLVSCRVTQLYDEGACVYFYFCMNFENVNEPSHIFSQIEAAARDEILSCGGSLSHHHGVGKLRARFMGQVNSDGFKDVLLDLKRSIDPNNIFGARNGVFGCASIGIGSNGQTDDDSNHND